jgi:energy-coupling factor transport system ATP-binding protein
MNHTQGGTDVVSIDDVHYWYAGSKRPALAGASLRLASGEVVGVVGPNDAGKTSLCLVAAGLAPNAIGGRLEGEVRLAGDRTSDLRPFELAQRVGILFQNASTQLSGTTATVWEEVAFGPRNLGLGLAEVVERVGWSMGVLRLDDLASRDPQRLSGGQSQLVALAAVLALRPAALVLDEPTSQLDPVGTRLVGEAIERLAETGSGVLIVEHKADLLLAMADRVALLVDGRVVATGRPEALLGDARTIAAGVEPPARIRLARALEAAGVPASVLPA